MLLPCLSAAVPVYAHTYTHSHICTLDHLDGSGYQPATDPELNITAHHHGEVFLPGLRGDRVKNLLMNCQATELVLGSMTLGSPKRKGLRLRFNHSFL